MLPLIPVSGKGVVDEHVSIIQHPQGATKQVVVRENRIIALDEQRFPSVSEACIHYTADTEQGSSGSPVFNDQWDLVALHHLAIVDRDTDGNPVNKDNKVWQPQEGEETKKWIANEGIRISAIWMHLQRAAAFDGDAARIMAVLAFDPQAPRRPTRSRFKPQKWETIPDAPEAAAFETTRFSDPAFKASQGYKPRFLGADFVIPLPVARPEFKGRLSLNTDTDRTVFDYTHFSLAMNADRRLAAWTAVNIDGGALASARSPSWRQDKRLPAAEQTLAEVYGKVPGKTIQIDRGHLVRRLDPVWGPPDVAERAGADTFHYTNAAPQEHVYNSETWGNLEDFILDRADVRDRKVTVMTGPILRPDDDFYGKDLKGGPWQIPWSFWKIVAFIRPDKSKCAAGFIVEQTRTLAPLFEASRYNPYTTDEARVFQKPIKLIEELTGLDFGNLGALDRIGEIETTAPARPIRDGDDMVF